MDNGILAFLKVNIYRTKLESPGLTVYPFLPSNIAEEEDYSERLKNLRDNSDDSQKTPTVNTVGVLFLSRTLLIPPLLTNAVSVGFLTSFTSIVVESNTLVRVRCGIYLKFFPIFP